jgi:hypothetical protein
MEQLRGLTRRAGVFKQPGDTARQDRP